MRLIINGQEHDVILPLPKKDISAIHQTEASCKFTILELLNQLNLNPAHIAVEKNGRIIDKNDYKSEPVHQGDSLELIRFMGGGCLKPKLPKFHIYPVITEQFCSNGSAVKTLKDCLYSGIKIVQLRIKNENNQTGNTHLPQYFELGQDHR